LAHWICSNTIAYLIALRFQPTPVFDLLARQDGLDLPSLEEVREEEPLRVEDAMQTWGFTPLRGEESASQAQAELARNPSPWLLLHDPESGWHLVSREELLAKLTAAPPGFPLAKVFAPRPVPVVYPDQSLETPLRHIGERPFLPVVHRANPARLVGIVSRDDVLRTYARPAEPAGSSSGTESGPA